MASFVASHTCALYQRATLNTALFIVDLARFKSTEHLIIKMIFLVKGNQLPGRIVSVLNMVKKVQACYAE